MLLTTKDPRLISYLTLRKAIGWLGISLPAVMVMGNYLFNNCKFLLETVSHYYYSVTGNLFVGILCAVGLFLFTYKGYNKIDHAFTSLAGLFAVLIALFSTNPLSENNCALFTLSVSQLRNTVHYISAALFFITLAGISLFLFTKSKGIKTKEKILRNMVYRTCGIVILTAIALIGLYHIFEEQLEGLWIYKPVFWLEWIALFAFGTSWLVKGELVLKDK